MTVPPAAPETAAILARLESTNLPVGDARAPDDGGWNDDFTAFTTYLVLYPILNQRNGPDASLADRWTDPVRRFQVTAVGVDRRAAETAGDIAASALLNRQDLGIDHRSTVLLVHDGSGGVTRDESVNPALFISVERYRLDTSN